MPHEFSLIVATTMTGGIGYQGHLPWPTNRTDMTYFRNITTQRLNLEHVNAIIMGRRTWESLGSKPLPHRLNICITSRPLTGVICFSSLEDALLHVYYHPQVERVFVIGGGQLYQEALWHPDCHELLVNRIAGDYECDTFFPEIDPDLYELTDSLPLGPEVYHEKYSRRHNVSPDTEYDHPHPHPLQTQTP